MIKITKRLLRAYPKNKRVIPLLEQELIDLRTTDLGIGNSVIMDYRTGQGRPQSVVGFDEEKYKKREESLKRKKAEVEAVEVWIAGIEDEQTRIVFQDKYMKEWTWTKIAIHIGYGNNADYPRLKIRDKYLKEKNIK